MWRRFCLPTAHRFRRGSRIRLEIANGDSKVTENVFSHEYSPGKIGRDTLYHDASRPSSIALPIVAEPRLAPVADGAGS